MWGLPRSSTNWSVSARWWFSATATGTGRPSKATPASSEYCCHDIVAEIELEGKIIAVTHGDRPALKSQMLSSQKYDYFFQGHTHVREDIRVGKTRLINPGAVARSNPPVAALLDLTADQLEYIELNPTV